MESEKQGGKEKCLKCLDTGWVFIQDPRETQPEAHRCPNGCKPKESR